MHEPHPMTIKRLSEKFKSHQYMHENPSHSGLATRISHPLHSTPPLWMAAVAAAKFKPPPTVLKPLLLRGDYDTLRWGNRVASQVIAV